MKSYVFPSRVFGSEHGVGVQPKKFWRTHQAGAYPVKIRFTGSKPSSVLDGIVAVAAAASRPVINGKDAVEQRTMRRTAVDLNCSARSREGPGS